MAPHMAMLGSTTQSINTAPTNTANSPYNPNLTVASIITNESNQTTNQTNNRQFSFQVIYFLSISVSLASSNAHSWRSYCCKQYSSDFK